MTLDPDDDNISTPTTSAAVSGTSRAQPDISVSDATCGICTDIFDTPVTLPCKHQVCEECLLGIVDHSNIECPYCRKRLNTWVRTNKIARGGTKKFIDKVLVAQLERLRENLASNNDNLQYAAEPAISHKRLSKPGEVGDDYRRQQEKVDRELRERNEREEEQSRALIEQLVEEEKSQQDASLEARLKEQEEADAKLARELDALINGPPPTEKRDTPMNNTRSKSRHKSSPTKRPRRDSSLVPPENKENQPPTHSKTSKMQRSKSSSAQLQTALCVDHNLNKHERVSRQTRKLSVQLKKKVRLDDV